MCSITSFNQLQDIYKNNDTNKNGDHTVCLDTENGQPLLEKQSYAPTDDTEDADGTSGDAQTTVHYRIDDVPSPILAFLFGLQVLSIDGRPGS